MRLELLCPAQPLAEMSPHSSMPLTVKDVVDVSDEPARLVNA